LPTHTAIHAASTNRMVGDGNSTAPPASGSADDEQGWWNNPRAQDITFDVLAGCYAVIALVALIQLLRIQRRVPEYGWTTQKVFHLLNFVCASFRAGVFPVWREVDALPNAAARAALMDTPGLLFFTTYALLVLFWAEIYHQARSFPTGALRPTFVGVNALVYAFQGSLWTWEGAQPKVGAVLEKVSALFLAFVCAVAAAGFVVYGGRLFAMLRSFPAESRGRQKKLREVGAVTAVCATCFTVRAVMVCTSAFAETKDGLDVMNHPVRNALYYACCEIAPSALVLFILRKLPPRTRRADERRTPRRERRGRDRGEVHGDDERREPLLGDEEEGRVRGRHRRNRD